MSNSNNQKTEPFERMSYFALALDPIHVGTGGYRLGRVDMSIVREPGTNLPKIPGTSIAGACRAYAAMQEAGKYPNCAGQKNHCGKSDCPICVTFGFSKGTQGSFQGLAQFSDARLVLFPVHSLAGPVWVTCPDVVKEFSDSKFEVEEDSIVLKAKDVKASKRLNLGWLMLDVKEGDLSLDGKFKGIPAEILDHTVLVSNKMFSHIVNDNLEVRTSVSIDPETGAASDGALFTYEALPRSSILALEVVVSNPKYFKINGSSPLGNDRKKVTKTVDNGLNWFESLGIGGMSTRGMGRMRVSKPKKEDTHEQ